MTLTTIKKAGLDELALDHVFTIGASGSSAYTFQGEGLNGTVNNPTLYLTRGKTYRFENGSGGHPIRIQSTSGASGTAYNTGVTNNAGSGTVIVEVQHDAPDVLYYQCTSHAAMNGILYITGALADGGVTTAKIADDAVTEAKIVSGAVTQGKLANNSVTNNKIAVDAIDNSHLSSNSVNTAEIYDEAITLAKLEHGTSSNDGKFLRANNGADPTFETVNTDLVSDTTPQLGGNLDTNGNNINFAANDGAVFAGDLTISHTGDHGNIVNTDGNLNIKSQGTISLFPANNNDGITIVNGGAVSLFHNNVKKFETTSTGALISGSLVKQQSTGSTNLVVGSTDASGAYLVLDGDSNGDASGGDYAYIEHGSDGNLSIHCDNPAGNSQFELYTGNGGTLSMLATSGGRVDLYYAGSKKFETQSYGAKVTGYLAQSAPVSWMAYADSSWYTISAGNSIYPFNFNNISHNIGSHYKNSGSDAGLFVAPIDGVYQLNWNIFMQSTTNQTTSATLEMYVRKNGGSVSRLHNKKGYGNMGDDQQVVNLCVTEQLSANDKIGVIFSSYGATWRIYGGHSTFSGFLVG